MIIEEEVKNRVRNNWSNKIHDLLSIGTVPETKDILACLHVTWHIKSNGSYINVSHIFDNTNTEYDTHTIKESTICTDWSSYKLGNKLLAINGRDLKINTATVTANELETMIFQYIVNHIKKTMPKSSIFFKTVSLAKAGGVV